MTQRKRQLAAVMFTDIEGYTALMQQDEQRALRVRDRHREVFRHTTLAHNGQILQYFGDGTLSIFNSALEAVNCAMEMQLSFQQEPKVPLRVGIHLGDIVITAEEVIGDAVNLASRIESMAIPGSVLMSDRVEAEIHNHADLQVVPLGLYQFKNVERSVALFALEHPALYSPQPEEMLRRGKVVPREVPSNLPQPATRFFGRVAELQQIEALLAQNRLVTLLGAGGCGKTRLSIEVGKRTLKDFPDGVWFISLAPVSDPELVVGAIAEKFQVNPQKEEPLEITLTKKLKDKQVLLVVDNCEHLIEECARLLNLLINQTTAPRFVATSREALHLEGESLFPISPFPLPQHQEAWEELMHFGAIQLFKDRALLSKPDFKLHEDNIEAVTEICQRLDGIPLAIEMAASRIKMMDPATILKRLANQFSLLGGTSRNAPEHQRTLRATIDWSNNLLSPKEQHLFYRLSIFQGDFDLEDVEQVCGFEPLDPFEILDLLSSLMDKSLVVAIERKNVTRYLLLEVMKQYGQEKLAQLGDLSSLQDHFTQHYLQQAEVAHQERTTNALRWSRWLTMELANIQGAQSLLEANPLLKQKMAALMVDTLFLHVHLSVGRKLLADALQASQEPSIWRARVLCGLGFMELLIDPELGNDKMLEGIAIIQELDDKQAKMDIYGSYSWLMSAAGKWDEAHQILEEGLRLAEELDNPWLALRYKNNMAWMALNKMDLESAESQVAGNLKEALALGNHYDIVDSYHIMADVAFLRENYGLAEQYYLEAIKKGLQLESDIQIVVLLHSMAQSLSGLGRHEEGLHLFASCEAKMQELEVVLPVLDSLALRFDRTTGNSRKVLGPEKAKAVEAEGRKMTFEEAVQYVIERAVADP